MLFVASLIFMITLILTQLFFWSLLILPEVCILVLYKHLTLDKEGYCLIVYLLINNSFVSKENLLQGSLKYSLHQ